MTRSAEAIASSPPVLLGLLVLFPELAMWLPGRVGAGP
jgi:hypothetical protein